MSHHLSRSPFSGFANSFVSSGYGHVPRGLFRAQQDSGGGSQHVVEKPVSSTELKKTGEIVDRRGMGFGAHLKR